MAVFKNLNLFGGKNSLLIGIVIGVLLGGIVGSFFPEFAVKQGFLGDMFLKALKMIVLPLIIISITLSIMKIGDPKKLGSMGLKTVL